jgi:hypothetical protein
MANTFVFDDDDQPQPDMGDTGSEQPEEPQPEEGEGSNRTFLIAAIILGGIVLLSLICMAVYALLILPGQNKAKISAEATNAVIASYSTATAVVDQLTQAASLYTPTTPPTETPLPPPTSTPVLAPELTATPGGIDAGTATQDALLTQLAISQKTGTPKPATPGNALTATALAKIAATKTSQLAGTGFADEVGLPGLFLAALVLVAVILLARRLRAAPLRR